MSTPPLPPAGEPLDLTSGLNSLLGTVAILDVRLLPKGQAWDISVMGH